MKLLLDTNVLSEPEFLKWLKNIEDAEKYMSSVTLMEFAYHLLKKGKGEGRLDCNIIPFESELFLFWPVDPRSESAEKTLCYELPAKYNFLYLEAPVFTWSQTLGENVVIKGVDEEAYRRLKSRASKEGLKIGQAASMAFKAWAQQGGGRLNQKRIRDIDRMKTAAEVIDSNRAKLKRVEDWSSVKVIRKWRQSRRA